MTLLSRKADYALLILSFLHHKPQGGNAREIAERFHLSRPFVANILKELGHKGYVTSHRGVKGGYVLARSADQITLAEILESVEDGFKLTVCSTGHDGHNTEEACTLENVCPMKGPLSAIHDRLMAMLRGVTLAELFTPIPSANTPTLLTLGAIRESLPLIRA